MDIGTKVKCGRCTNEMYLYAGTHKSKTVKDGVLLAGICTTCAARISGKTGPNSTIYYAAKEKYPNTKFIPYHGGN